MRYRLRTLMIILAVGPPVLAGLWLLGVRLTSEPALVQSLGLAFTFACVIATPLYGLAFVFWVFGAGIANALSRLMERRCRRK